MKAIQSLRQRVWAQIRTHERSPLISCMLVTRRRPVMLKRAVTCFLQQTYKNSDLVIVCDSDDSESIEHVQSINNSRISLVVVDGRCPLGTLRNTAVDRARGAFIAQWDDDDWHSPHRLAEQLGAIMTSGKAACVLSRWVIFDSTSCRAYLSPIRRWEGSLLARKSALARYNATLSMGEDTPVVNDLFARGELALLDRPYLYVYVFHGGNTFGSDHWNDIIRHSDPLPAADCLSIAAALAH
jgi:glycosyltransferase involved in cell wall biosynthesis